MPPSSKLAWTKPDSSSSTHGLPSAFGARSSRSTPSAGTSRVRRTCRTQTATLSRRSCSSPTSSSSIAARESPPAWIYSGSHTRAVATRSSTPARGATGPRAASPPNATKGLAVAASGDGAVRLVEREGVAFGVLAAREPTNLRDRLLVVGLPAPVADLRDARVDVAGVEVDDWPTLARLLRIHGSHRLDAIGHVVLHRPLVVSELPIENVLVELPCPLR